MRDSGSRPTWLGRAALALFSGISILFILLLWLNTPVGGLMPEALAALESDARVLVTRDRWISFEPAEGEAQAGVVFYPGGRVAAEAYAPLGRALAENGLRAVIVPMPLNLALFNPDAAAAVIAANAPLQHWLIAGHSLGGVMAARFAHSRPDLADGLALLAAWPEAHIDLSQRDLAVALIYGDRDGLATPTEVLSALPRLPADTRSLPIDGGNHAQFGWYGDQPGDNPASISRGAQLTQVVAAILNAMRESGISI